LARAEAAFHQLRTLKGMDRDVALITFHRTRVNEISVAWANDTKAIGAELPKGISVTKTQAGDALAVMPIAVTKAVTEASILRSMTAGADALGRITDEEAWRKIAGLHSEDAKLDYKSISLINRQTFSLFVREGSADPAQKNLAALIRRFEQNLALDSVRNEFLLHLKLHTWMGGTKPWDDLEALNEKVYAELFMTPRSDSWLGLLAADAYTGLENGGVVR
jgi:hypothetical protein